MAIMDTMWCPKCKQKKSYCRSAAGATPRVCGECAANDKKSKKDLWLEEQAKLPLEQRLAYLESYVYDLHNDKPWERDCWDGRIG